MESRFDITSKTSSSIETSYTYKTCGGMESVVFTVIPFDVYQYKVLSSPEAVDIGSYMAISIPRELKTFFTERSYYNENNGAGMDIDNTILSYTLGNPGTYSKEADIDKTGLDAGGFYSVPMTVGQGGTTTIGIQTSTSSGYGAAFSTSVTVEAETSGTGFLIGGSAGYHAGYSYTNTTTNTTIFSGTVGGIVNKEIFPSKVYDWGLFVKPVTYLEQEFVVINYFVN